MTDVRVSGVFREVLNADATATLNVSGIFREVLVSSETVIGVSGLFREVLRTNELPPPPVPPGPGNWWPWARRALAEPEIEEAWYPLFRRGTPSITLVSTWRRPLFQLTKDEIEETWYPLFRRGVPSVAGSIVPWKRPNFIFMDITEAPSSSPPWSRRSVQVAFKKMRPYLQINT